MKTMLLFNGNQVNSTPIVREVNITETQEYHQGLLQKHAMENTGWINVLT